MVLKEFKDTKARAVSKLLLSEDEKVRQTKKTVKCGLEMGASGSSEGSRSVLATSGDHWDRLPKTVRNYNAKSWSKSKNIRAHLPGTVDAMGPGTCCCP